MPRSKSKARARAVSGKGRSALSPGVRSVVAFYEGSAKPFRLPDAYRGPTAVKTLIHDATSPAATQFGIGFYPSLAAHQQNVAVTAGNLAATWTPTAHSQLSLMTTNALRARVNAMRVTVTYVGKATDACGTLYVGSSNTFSTTMISASLASYSGTMKLFPLEAGRTYTFYASQFGESAFENPATVGSFMGNGSGLVFLVSGSTGVAGVLNFRTEVVSEYITDGLGSSLAELRAEPYDQLGVIAAGVLSGQDSTTKGEGWASSIVEGAAKLAWGGATGAATTMAYNAMAGYLLDGFYPME